MLAMTGLLIYPADQFRLRDIPLRSPWLPSLYEINTWSGLMRSLAVTPEGWLYATHRYGIFFSQDGGRSWQDLTERLPGSFAPDQERFPPVLALCPSDPRTIIASKGRGLARSTNGGKTWESFGDSDNEDLSQSIIQTILFRSGSMVLVIDAQGFVYRRPLAPEADEGWERVPFGLPYGEQRGVGVLDWHAVALLLHNGQGLSERHWWLVNDGFALILLLLALTGLVPWGRRKVARRMYPKRQRRIKTQVFRTLHHVGGLASWPLFFLFPLTGVVLLHAVDIPALLSRGLPARWFPAQFDHNRWQGPLSPHLRTLAVSPTDASRLWAGHTYGLFASEDGGQHWSNMGAALQTSVVKDVEHLLVGPWWFDFLYVGNARGVQVSRDYGRHWQVLLEQPVEALYAGHDTMYVASGDALWRQKFHTLIALVPAQWEKSALAPPYGPQRSSRQTTLYQLLHDLHSGRLLGAWVTYLLDAVAGLMLLQTVTGLLLWGVVRWRRWQRVRRLAGVISLLALVGVVSARAAEPSPSPGAVALFTAARQTGDLQALLAALQRTGQGDNEDAAMTVLYAGLSEPILAGLSEEQTEQVLAAAQEVLIHMTDQRAWKVTYRTTAKHPDWRVRSMLLEVVKTRAAAEDRAQKAIVACLTDSTDAVALKAIDLAGDLQIKQAVPKLMQLVIAKWGQHVGVGAAKATLALEKITGTTEPAGWHEWVNKHL
jgi:photosystem II stability/assembly factor-like uncharacterized protein